MSRLSDKPLFFSERLLTHSFRQARLFFSGRKESSIHGMKTYEKKQSADIAPEYFISIIAMLLR